ncbi:MAG: GspMb/PilO family protein [Pseudomonadota bacterium]
MQQSLALLITAAVVSLTILWIVQPMFGAAEAQFRHYNRLGFEAQRIERAVQANAARSIEDLATLEGALTTQVFNASTLNKAQSALQSLVSTSVQTSSGLLNSMRLGETKERSSGLTALTLDVTATLPEEQLMVFLEALAQAPQRISVPKLTIQKTSSFDDRDTDMTLDLRVIGYWFRPSSPNEPQS